MLSFVPSADRHSQSFAGSCKRREGFMFQYTSQGLMLTRSTDISYWKAQVGTLGFIKEVAGAALTGGVANTGVLRQMTESEISTARSKDSSMTS